jgi:ABC-2 type transport system ATP-binding protein
MRQSPAFTLRNTINQHLEVMRRALGVTSQRVDDCLKEVGLEDRRRSRIGSLSGGLRQRLSLAGAILGDPRILILDEPANGMDPESAALLRRLIRGLAGRGGAVLVSTHQLAELSLWADSCYVINQGRVKSRLDSATVQDPEALFDAFLQATSGQGA